MYRKLIAAMLILIAATLVNPVNADDTTPTTTYETRYIRIMNFDHGFTAAMLHTDGDSYTAVKMTAVDMPTFEDLFDHNPTNMLTATLALDERGYTGIMTVYSSEYGKDTKFSYIDYTDDHHMIGYVNTANGVTTGQLDGIYAQFHGPVVNGPAIKLRSANAYSVSGTGYILQNGNLISYVVGNGEESVKHTVVLPVVLF